MSQNGVRFSLRDDSNDPWYYLDDQEQASKYLGKAIQVIGILDGPHRHDSRPQHHRNQVIKSKSQMAQPGVL
jgi:hypothetical protein